MARTVPVTGYIAITCPTGGGATPVVSAKISNNTGVHQGQLVGWKGKANNCTNAITYTLSIQDRDADTIYTSAGGHAKNATTLVMGLNIPIIERETITITPSGEPGATALIVQVTLYYNPDADIIAWGYR